MTAVVYQDVASAAQGLRTFGLSDELLQQLQDQLKNGGVCMVVEQGQAAQLRHGGHILEVGGSPNPQMQDEERFESGGESTAESGQ